jgi:Ala-tRNA(Pro) deacylase
MATPFWIKRMLDLRGIPYQELHHPDVFTAQEVAQREHFSGHRVAKVVVVMADGRPVELVLPASRHVNLGRVRGVLNAREVHLATEAEMETFFTDCEVGATPPLRHWKEVEVLMDRALDVDGDILFQAGTHTDAIRLNFRDWYELVDPQVASFSEPAEPAWA